MKLSPFSLCRVFLIGCILLPVPGRGEEGTASVPGSFGLEFGEGRVTLRAEKARLGTILEELSRRAGFELFLYVPADEPVTADFRGIPLEEALARLLPSHGFLFRRSREGELALRAVAVVPSGPGEGVRGRFAFSRVARLPYGSGPGQVGRISDPEMERQGPQSFAVGEGGEVYLADTVNRRVQVFGPEGKFSREIPLPAPPRDIAVSNDGDVFVLDDPGRTIFRFGAGGERLPDIRLDPRLAERLETMRWSGGELLLRTRDGEEFELAGPNFTVPKIPEKASSSPRGSRLPSGDYCRVRKVSGEEAEVAITGPDGEIRDTIPVPVDRLASIVFLGSYDYGNILLQVEQVRPDGVGVDLGVLVMNPAGIVVEKIERMPNNYANWTSRLLRADSRGDVYQALPAPGAVELNRWSRQIEEAGR